MEAKLQLVFFMLFIQVSLTLEEHVTVIKGDTLFLRCPIKNAHQKTMEWKNPHGQIMFHNDTAGKDDTGKREKRYSLDKRSKSEYTVSVSHVTFEDGGTYTCTDYSHHITEKTWEVTVLGLPKLKVTKHKGKFVLRCTAKASQYQPQISWQLDSGPEIVGFGQAQHNTNKRVSTATLSLLVKTSITVKCLVRHSFLHSGPLMDFITIGQYSKRRSSTGLVKSQTPKTTEMIPTATQPTQSDRKTMIHPTREIHEQTNAVSDSTTSEAISNTRSTNGSIAVTETTEKVTSFDSTEENTTVNANDKEMQETPKGSSLLVFLVTCLILALMVMVLFFAIQLRRAHINWKKENDNSDPSDESSKSKSSQKDRNTQGHQQRGLFNTIFAHYNVEEPTVSVITVAAEIEPERTENVQNSLPQTSEHTSAKTHSKETEL